MDVVTIGGALIFSRGRGLVTVTVMVLNPFKFILVIFLTVATKKYYFGKFLRYPIFSQLFVMVFQNIR